VPVVGVVIPWTVEGAPWHVKLRRFGDDSKYIRIRGGEPTLYGLDHLEGRPAVVICEGELDAALLHQEAGDLVDVVAIGTKAAKAELKGLAHLLGASHWLLALDRDAEAEADVWAEYSDRVRRIRPLEGNDITDFHNAGGDLRLWIEYHLARLGSPGLETEAARILEHGDLARPSDRRRYAEIGELLGWPYWGCIWQEGVEFDTTDRLNPHTDARGLREWVSELEPCQSTGAESISFRSERYGLVRS
jgi:hypothetical protein